MHTLADLSAALNRDNLAVRALRERFQLPSFPGAGYPDAYLRFLRRVVQLEALNVSGNRLAELWKREKALLKLLHFDESGSETWFLDACGQRGHRERRLLLSNVDLGADLSTRTVQLRLDFAKRPAELFPAAEMGEDAFRALDRCLKLRREILAAARKEVRIVRSAMRWIEHPSCRR